MKLIDEWKQWHKFWSIRLQAAGVAILTLVQGFPDALVSVWSTLPTDITAAFPASTVKWIGIAVLVCGVGARVVQQDKLHAGMGGESGPGVSGDGNRDLQQPADKP
ncbi:hypothetical protein [Castellaniella sp.]|uniref:DUF7940 domain-containing protein n=1 Tax=Castellaniella sp. TaxID=1955812 RepID=UPI0025C690BD|nr:hypothetical protein [Castellaniella sp.]